MSDLHIKIIAGLVILIVCIMILLSPYQVNDMWQLVYNELKEFRK